MIDRDPHLDPLPENGKGFTRFAGSRARSSLRDMLLRTKLKPLGEVVHEFPHHA